MSEKQFMPELEALPREEAKRRLDLKAQEMQLSVINAPNYIPKGERVIYVSNDGDDKNDGLSIDTPIKTIAKVNEIVKPKDTFLFRRGDHFRGNILLTEDDVTYASYGEGIKPIIDASARNYADPSFWIPTDAENIWECIYTVNNVGIVHINPEYTYGNYNEIYADMILRDSDEFSYKSLTRDLQCYNDRDTNKIYFYSAKGNPGSRWNDIEIGGIGHCIGGFGSHANGITVDGLWLMHSGNYGVGSITNERRTIRNCVFSWIGGSMHDPSKRPGVYNRVRYGNAIEIYGGCKNFTVENNWIYQIFDTGITHQYSFFSSGDCIQHDVLYLNNLVEYCYWGIEFYNGEHEGTKREVKNVLIKGNFVRYTGYGWGCKPRGGGVSALNGSGMCKDVENFLVENNIFMYNHNGPVVWMANDEGSNKIELHNNVYINPYGGYVARVSSDKFPFDETAKDTLKRLYHEQEPTVLFLNGPESYT